MNIADVVLIKNFSEQASETAALFKAMANDRRLQILCNLAAESELTVGALVDRIGISPSALSQHLAILRGENLVTCRREAQAIHYRIANARAERLLILVSDLF